MNNHGFGRWRLRLVCSCLAAAAAAFGQSGYKPEVPNLRVTDIQSVAADPEGNRFQIMFEFNNWTNAPVTSIALLANVGSTIASDGIGAKVQLLSAGTKAAGRPILFVDVNSDGVINTTLPASNPASDLEDINGNGVLDPLEDKNNNGRLDNDPLPGKPFQNTNNWSVSGISPTSAQWSGGTALTPRDLASQASPGTRCLRIPGCQVINGYVTIPNPETIDNGTHAMDGFVVEVDGWYPGDVLSLDWFFLSAGVGIADPYAAGVLTLFREVLPFGGPLPPGLYSDDTPFFQKDRLHYFFGGVFRDPPPLPQDRWFSASLGHDPKTPLNAAVLPAGVQVVNPGQNPNGIGNVPGVAFPTLVQQVPPFTYGRVPNTDQYKITANFKNVTAAGGAPGWTLGRLCFVNNPKTDGPPQLKRGDNGEVFWDAIQGWVSTRCNGRELFPPGQVLSQEFLIRLGNGQPFKFYVDGYDGNAGENNQLQLTPGWQSDPQTPVTVVATLGKTRGPNQNTPVTLRVYDGKTNQEIVALAGTTDANGRASFVIPGQPHDTIRYLRAEYQASLQNQPVRRYSNMSVFTWMNPPPEQQSRVRPDGGPDHEY